MVQIFKYKCLNCILPKKLTKSFTMKKFDFKIGPVTIKRSFRSRGDIFVYLAHIGIKLVLLAYFFLLPLAYTFNFTGFIELNRVLFTLITAILVFYLMIIKRLISPQPTVKGVFDMLLLLFSTFTLISVVFNENKTLAVFGQTGLHVYSIIYLLSFLILFFGSLEVFSYKRGLKWVLASLNLSALVFGVWHIYQIEVVDWREDVFFYEYAFFLFFLTATSVIVLKRTFLKWISALGSIALLWISAYSDPHLTWSVSIIFLLIVLVLYLRVWMDSNDKILDLLYDVKNYKKYQGSLMLLGVLVISAILLITGLYYTQKFTVEEYVTIKAAFERLDLVWEFKNYIIGFGINDQLVTLPWSIGSIITFGLISPIVFYAIGAKFMFDITRSLTVSLLKTSFIRFLTKLSHVLAVGGVFIFSLYSTLHSLLLMLVLIGLLLHSKAEVTLPLLDSQKDSTTIKAIRISGVLILTGLLVYVLYGVSFGIDQGLFEDGVLISTM